MPHMLDSLTRVVLTALFLCGSLVPIASAQINERLIAPAGLEIHWENSLGGAGLAHGDQSLKIWPHATDRREYVDVFLGNRLIERIDARQVDRAAIDRLILEGKPLKPAPVLGLEGAKARAEELAKTYAVLGKQVSIQTFSEPIVYVVTATKNGIVSAIDGESGELLWQSTVPNPELPIYGPGVSDSVVVVVNGNNFYAMDLKTGNLINSSKLYFTPTSSPIPSGDYIMVPSVGGRIVGYHMAKPLIRPVYLRASTENRNGLAISIGRDFLSWTSHGSLYLIHSEEEPMIWSRVNANEEGDSRPVTTPNGFIFCTDFGTVIHATTNRLGSYLWRNNLGMPTARSPVIGNKTVIVLSDDGLVDALDLETGKSLWPSRAQNISSVLGVGKAHVYVRDSGGYLASLRLSDGQLDSRTGSLTQGVVPNSVNDRFFVVTRDGHLSCLRERGAIMPTMYLDPQAAKEAVGSPNKPSNQQKPAPTKSVEDPFGASGLDAAPAASDAKDPFDPF
jgi:outer membrane protein assembly factor BamB